MFYSMSRSVLCMQPYASQADRAGSYLATKWLWHLGKWKVGRMLCNVGIRCVRYSAREGVEELGRGLRRAGMPRGKS